MQLWATTEGVAVGEGAGVGVLAAVGACGAESEPPQATATASTDAARLSGAACFLDLKTPRSLPSTHVTRQAWSRRLPLVKSVLQ